MMHRWCVPLVISLTVACVQNSNSHPSGSLTNAADSLRAAEKFDLDRQSEYVVDLMDPLVQRGVVLTGYQRLVYCRNKSDYLEETINHTDSLYQVYLNDTDTGDSRENLLVSYLHFLSSNRLFGLAEQYADTLVARYGGAQRKYMDMRYMYYFLSASDKGDCAVMHEFADSLRKEVILQGRKSIIKQELVDEYTNYLHTTCP